MPFILVPAKLDLAIFESLEVREEGQPKALDSRVPDPMLAVPYRNQEFADVSQAIERL